MKLDEILPDLPRAWRSELEASRARHVRAGMSGATLFYIQHQDFGNRYLKIARGPDAIELRSEIERMQWLGGQGVRVPTPVRIFHDGQFAALIMTVVPGVHPHRSKRPVADIVRLLARALLDLHSIAPQDCPFDETVAARLARARNMIASGRIEPEHFDARNYGMAPSDIYDRLLDSVPEREDLVVVHGDATFENLLIDGAGRVGFIDCGNAGRGDRYLDLAAVMSDIEEYFGPEWIQAFAAHYDNFKLDRAKLLFFSDLYELF